MKTFSEENPEQSKIPGLPPAGRERRGPGATRGARPRQREFDIRHSLVAAFSNQPRTAARAGRLARKHASLRHRARGNIGRIIWLINEAGRLEEVRNER
jgi:hypothetical protein